MSYLWAKGKTNKERETLRECLVWRFIREIESSLDSGLLIPLLVIVSALLIISIIWDIVKRDQDGKNKKKGEEELIYNPNAKNRESVREIEIDFTKHN